MTALLPWTNGFAVSLVRSDFRLSRRFGTMAVAFFLGLALAPTCVPQSPEPKRVLMLTQSGVTWSIFRLIDENMLFTHLENWKIPESGLPAGSVALFRQRTFWQGHNRLILISAVVTSLQLLLILLLLHEQAKRRNKAAELMESERRFRVMADATAALIWMRNKHGKITYVNDPWFLFVGRQRTVGPGDTWTAYIHPDDLQNVQHATSRGLERREPFSTEYRVRRQDGVYRWMFDVASPRFNGDGTFAGFIGSAADITDQKLAQGVLQQISGQLIEAQEEERSRVARELHDDICQRLAMLSMELEQANSSSDGSAAGTKERLANIREHCSEIASDVQSLSHQLHSPKLDYLGIVTALRSFSKEFSEQHHVNVIFTSENVPHPLPKDISLCLFRVAQEALQNAVKHSGVSQFSVDLRGAEHEVRLEVKDAGAGFNIEDAKRNLGLGIVSMQERVHLVKGQFSIESKPNVGTTIITRVPLAAENTASSAASA